MTLSISGLAAFATQTPISTSALASRSFLGRLLTLYHDLEYTSSFFSSDVGSFQCIARSIKEQCKSSVTKISVRYLLDLIPFTY